jgi:hypothetical protein
VSVWLLCVGACAARMSLSALSSGVTGVDLAAPVAQVAAARHGAGRLAARALVPAGCCLGLMAAFWLLSGSNAHASTAGRATPATSTPSSSGGLLSLSVAL